MPRGVHNVEDKISPRQARNFAHDGDAALSLEIIAGIWYMTTQRAIVNNNNNEGGGWGGGLENKLW